ncbi:MAG: hypothetical protein JWR19_1024 [Pedosphaera sp.]|nr:hypothetical protein [Pedosphaera sp.]
MKPLVVALLISVAFHAIVALTVLVFGVTRIFDFMNQKAVAELARAQSKTNMQAFEREAPLLFVEVDPTTATPDAPKNAKYYASKNTKAANPDAQRDTDAPKIDGTQMHVPKVETTPQLRPFPLQPSPPKEPNPQEETTEPKPKGGQPVGDLAMSKPNTKPDPQVGEAPAETHPRPRTLAEAHQQQPSLAGEKMRQDGGVKRRAVVTSLGAKESPFGDYDGVLIRAIQAHWYDLLNEQAFARDRTGRVTLEFRLNYDGRITDMRVIENGVDEVLSVLCQRAITDPSPYAPWPSDMRRLIGADYREVRFTFFYE